MRAGRPLKIAQVAPIIDAIPPKKYGGSERIVNDLTEELVRRGHQVTLFASGDSVTSADLISVVPTGLRKMGIDGPQIYSPYTAMNIGMAYDMSEEFDIIHDHNLPPHISLPLANLSKCPSVYTLHGPLKHVDCPEIFSKFPNSELVAISYDQAEHFRPYANNIRVVQNGLQMEDYPFSNEPGGFILYIGRFCFDKGAHVAIEVAKATGMPLIMAGMVEDQDYFDKFIKPHLNNDTIKWIGEVDTYQRNKLMTQALCMIHPITWDEPFGLTLIESMACGCPVVAVAKGAIPEIVKHGKTGFIAKDLKGLIDGTKKAAGLNRSDCRRHALMNFSARRMADGYERLYYSIIKQKAVAKNLKTLKLAA